jgi:hypothetical protein
MNQPCQRFTGGPQPSPTLRLAAAPGPAQLASQRPPRVAAQGSVEEAPSLQHGSITTELGAVCGMTGRSSRGGCCIDQPVAQTVRGTFSIPYLGHLPMENARFCDAEAVVRVCATG